MDLLRKVFFKSHHSSSSETEPSRELVSLVLEHAKKVIAHPSRPMVTSLESFLRKPFFELALEESMEEERIGSINDHFLAGG